MEELKKVVLTKREVVKIAAIIQDRLEKLNSWIDAQEDKSSRSVFYAQEEVDNLKNAYKKLMGYDVRLCDLKI